MSTSTLPLGVLAMADTLPAESWQRYVQSIETLGYDSFWIPELFGREPVASAAFLLARTERIAIATGIANIYVRDAHAMAQTRHTLAELAPGRFILGLGVSNVGLNSTRGHTWEAPLTKLTRYLDELAAVDVAAAAPSSPASLIVAAHGPRLQQLAAARSDGVLTYLMSTSHTQQSRERLGPGPELNVVCPMLAEPDPDRARRTIRAVLSYYLTLDYYHREWRKLGFTDQDFADGGSDTLIDTIVAWGDRAALRQRVAEHAAAGATRVIVLPLDALDPAGAAGATLRAIAPSD
jgi:probable F420-dependent oxidoreductase